MTDLNSLPVVIIDAIDCVRETCYGRVPMDLEGKTARPHKILRDYILRVTTENKELKKDAARWRWVRDNPRTFGAKVLCSQPPSWSPSDNISACVDAAMQTDVAD